MTEETKNDNEYLEKSSENIALDVVNIDDIDQEYKPNLDDESTNTTFIVDEEGDNESENEDSYNSEDDETDTNYDSDDSEDENYLQKLKNNSQASLLEEYHPQTQFDTSEEVKKFSIVHRDKDGIIVDPLHKTIPVLTKYEYTRIIGQRAKQINNDGKSFVKVPDGIIDGYHIAKLEFEERKIPFIIRRPIPGGGFEYWNVHDLEYIR